MKLRSPKRKCQIKAKKGLWEAKSVNGLFLAFSESDKIFSPVCNRLGERGQRDEDLFLQFTGRPRLISL